MGAVVLCQIPNSYAARTVAADDFTLVGVNHNIIRGAAVVVASLDGPRPGLPYFDSAVLRTCDHPFSLAVESDAGNVSRMTFKCQQRVWVR